MMQTRDRVQCLTLPKLNDMLLCPYTAVKALFSLYPMSATTSLLQIPVSSGYIPLTGGIKEKGLLERLSFGKKSS